MSAGAGAATGGGLHAAAELHSRVRRLELAARRNVAGLLAGDWTTSIPGRGLTLRELRKYVPGEPVRRISWPVTARLGEPYVKVTEEERRREVWLAVDVSPSMHTGFTRRTKLETAVELAASIAVSSIEAGDRLGHVLFADRALEVARPRPGRAQLFRTLGALLDRTAPWRRPVDISDPRAAIHAIEAHRGRRFVVFLISDFIDHDLPDDLRYLRARHDVSLLWVWDPVELAAASGDEAPAIFDARSPEGSAGGGPVQPGELESAAGTLRLLERRAARHRIQVGSFSTAERLAPALDRFFHLKRRFAFR